MRRILSWVILSTMLSAPPALAAWPFTDVLEYECEQAMEQRKVNGFGCKLNGGEIQIGIFNFFEDDIPRGKAARHQRLKLVSKYVLAGGTRVEFIDVTKKPMKLRACNLQTSGENRGTFWCQKWREVTESEK